MKSFKIWKREDIRFYYENVFIGSGDDGDLEMFLEICDDWKVSVEYVTSAPTK